jgi:PiT family inorganic phosphate transporter
MGVGAQRGLRCLNLGIVREMAIAWVLTFPVCGAIGFVMTRLFLWIL